MTELTFALIREGTSDDGLVAHLRTLMIKAGASKVVGASREYKGPTKERISQVLAEQAKVDLIFVHRDADSSDPKPRYEEIHDAASSLGCSDRVVPVVPVQELEAWLLADEAQIRSVAGRPSGKQALGVPSLSKIESTKSPKEILQKAYLAASETKGARYKRQAKQFPQHRATLLERLDHDGPIKSLPSWQRFVEDVTLKTTELCS
ncbi:DUF4276 family protein [Pseudarthrobacter sp. NPDC092184]|uniref:DUF4276 family protein n=1 Tax=unclassified Pseudarthrobacter TaxID=2647000 RepID=UPI003824ACD2